MLHSHHSTCYSGIRVKKCTSGRGPLFLFMRTPAKHEADAAIVIAEPCDLTSPELERHLGAEIRKHAAEIIRGLVQKAIEGGAVQAKFLFDFAGLSESPPQESKGESLLDLMRRELRLEQPPEGTVE
jgi:hypothetical protein